MSSCLKERYCIFVLNLGFFALLAEAFSACEAVHHDLNGHGRCRDRPTMPFRCLDAQYRRELVRVYLTNVETICRKFVDERRAALARLRDDSAGLRAFWSNLEPHQRQSLASERGDVLLKVHACNLQHQDACTVLRSAARLCHEPLAHHCCMPRTLWPASSHMLAYSPELPMASRHSAQPVAPANVVSLPL